MVFDETLLAGVMVLDRLIHFDVVEDMQDKTYRCTSYTSVYMYILYIFYGGI